MPMWLGGPWPRRVPTVLLITLFSHVTGSPGLCCFTAKSNSLDPGWDCVFIFLVLLENVGALNMDEESAFPQSFPVAKKDTVKVATIAMVAHSGVLVLQVLPRSWGEGQGQVSGMEETGHI